MFIKGKSLLLACGFLVAVFPLRHPAVASQQSSVPSSEDYEQTLDLLFPQTPADLPDARLEFALRFEPSHGGESEVVILWDRGAFHAIEYTVTKGNLWTTLIAQRDRNGRIDKSSAAKAIEVRKKHLRITPERHEQLLSEFFDSFSKTAAAMNDAHKKAEQNNGAIAVLDGTTYRLTYRGYPADISLMFQDVSANSRQDSRFELIDWMNRIHEELSTSEQ